MAEGVIATEMIWVTELEIPNILLFKKVFTDC
jgi:hypothetical protein